MVTTYSKFRLHTEAYLDKVFAGKSPLVVKRAKGEHVVVLRQSEYDSIMETLYLMRTPANTVRLLRAIEDSKHWNAKR